MKKIKITGVAVIILAVAVLILGIITQNENGSFAGALTQARTAQAQVDDYAKAGRNAAALEKKVSKAQDSIAACPDIAAQAQADVETLDQALLVNNTGDADVDTLLPALENITGEGVEAIQTLTDEKVLALYRKCVDDAYTAVNAAETAINDVCESANKIFSLVGSETVIEPVTITAEPDCASIEDCKSALNTLSARVDELNGYTDTITDWQTQASAAAESVSDVSLSLRQRLTIMLAENFIGIVFTSVLLVLIGLVMIFLAEPFKRQWRKNPVFSVGMATIVMLIVQTYALGFNHGSLGEWAGFWLNNTMNVLRANSSVGMIALSMTLVIIIGGIDLAVGSTLAGVGTVLMVMLDTGDHGFLIRFGITGVPAFIIGIIVALIVGGLIGGLIGLIVTKGKIPPFIVTLGIMNIVRSVSQYFTKSYKPAVPDAFKVIANTDILGQKPLTIVYWLVMAVIFYLLMRNTTFGRHVYAVGSNERTTRLSGINTDRVKRIVYIINGIVVAVAAVAQLSRLGGMDVASAGSGYELDSIAAVVVGGTSMSGGKGSIVGTVLGVLIIGIMNNLLVLLGVDAFLTDAFKGAIVVAAVLMQRKEANA